MLQQVITQTDEHNFQVFSVQDIIKCMMKRKT